MIYWSALFDTTGAPRLLGNDSAVRCHIHLRQNFLNRINQEKMEPEVMKAELVLPTHLSFKRIQMYEKYPKGQARGRHWKHLKQILQAENFQNYPPDEPNYVNIESPPSMHPCKRICDITGYEAPYLDPRTKLSYASADVFKLVRSLPNEYVQRYLALRNAAVVLK